MPFEQFLIVIAGIITGGALGLTFIVKITGLIRHWIDSRHNKSLTAQQLENLASLDKFKVVVEKRLQTLEAIAAEDRDFSGKVDVHYTAELGDPDNDSGEESGKLKNMLRQRS